MHQTIPLVLKLRPPRRYPTADEALHGARLLYARGHVRAEEVAFFRARATSPQNTPIRLSRAELVAAGNEFARRFDLNCIVTPTNTPTCFMIHERVVRLKEANLLHLLHELGHARYGASETLATAWSTAMCLVIWPHLAKNKRFKGHLLVT